jgi:hypothetical protein
MFSSMDGIHITGLRCTVPFAFSSLYARFFPWRFLALLCKPGTTLACASKLVTSLKFLSLFAKLSFGL